MRLKASVNDEVFHLLPLSMHRISACDNPSVKTCQLINPFYALFVVIQEDDGDENEKDTKWPCRCIRIDGATPSSTRQQLCDQFQEDPAVRLAILSLMAAGTGLTLTAASLVLFAELFFNPGVLLQAEDRAHRIGRARNFPVTVQYLLAKGTTDDRIW